MNINFYQIDNMHLEKGTVVKLKLIMVINDWAKILDNGGQVDTFILDFKKAFDTHHMSSLRANRLAVA